MKIPHILLCVLLISVYQYAKEKKYMYTNEVCCKVDFYVFFYFFLSFLLSWKACLHIYFCLNFWKPYILFNSIWHLYAKVEFRNLLFRIKNKYVYKWSLQESCVLCFSAFLFHFCCFDRLSTYFCSNVSTFVLKSL